ncbi:hypothetical protein TNCV_558621 [Trichonephila clavipes]|nr:hypothetical protein TNCV_558621 [Trichonephila clavipes]
MAPHDKGTPAASVTNQANQSSLITPYTINKNNNRTFDLNFITLTLQQTSSSFHAYSTYHSQFTHRGNLSFCNSLNNLRAANIEPVYLSPSSNHQATFQPFKDGHFYHFDFVSKCLLATPFLHVPTNNQVVLSPSGTINNYDMGWRLALSRVMGLLNSCMEHLRFPGNRRQVVGSSRCPAVIQHEASQLCESVIQNCAEVYDERLHACRKYRHVLQISKW